MAQMSRALEVSCPIDPLNGMRIRAGNLFDQATGQFHLHDRIFFACA
jgi:hypothetical protein